MLYKDSRTPDARSRLPSTVTVAASRPNQICREHAWMMMGWRRVGDGHLSFFFSCPPSSAALFPFSSSSTSFFALYRLLGRLGQGLGGHSHQVDEDFVGRSEMATLPYLNLYLIRRTEYVMSTYCTYLALLVSTLDAPAQHSSTPLPPLQRRARHTVPGSSPCIGSAHWRGTRHACTSCNHFSQGGERLSGCKPFGCSACEPCLSRAKTFGTSLPKVRSS